MSQPRLPPACRPHARANLPHPTATLFSCKRKKLRFRKPTRECLSSLTSSCLSADFSSSHLPFVYFSVGYSTVRSIDILSSCPLDVENGKCVFALTAPKPFYHSKCYWYLARGSVSLRNNPGSGVNDHRAT